jgi:hypothetical protein
MLGACLGARKVKLVSHAQNLLYQLFVIKSGHSPVLGCFGTCEYLSSGEILQYISKQEFCVY